MNRHVMKPTVHLNGTSRDELTRQYEGAADAVEAAIHALSECAPNGRDYYPLGADAFVNALAEHLERHKRLTDTHAELLEIVWSVRRD